MTKIRRHKIVYAGFLAITKQYKLIVCMLTFLVGNGARGLASRLAGSLAFTAATFSSTCFQVGFIDGIDMFHLKVLLPLTLPYL